MIKEVKIPEIGENIENGDVIEILVSVGELVEIDQSLIEFETDKAVVDIPSPEKGKIVEILVKKGDTVNVGQTIVKIETEAAGAAKKSDNGEAPSKKPEKKETAAAPVSEIATETVKEEVAKEEPPANVPVAPVKDVTLEIRESGRAMAPASPTVRRLARELGADINSVNGSGPGGRISVEDVKAYVKRVVTSKESARQPVYTGGPAQVVLPDLSRWGKIEREKLSRVRRLIAESTSNSWSLIPHVTQFDKANITQVEEFRKGFNKKYKKDNTKLTVTAILMKIIAEAVRKFPRFNASIDIANSEIVYRKYCHIGIAVDTDRGLLVPVVRDVDKKSIVELAHDLNDIAQRTRDRKINPDELEGGTFTISNQGGIGGTDFTPIVLWPQVAILGISRAAMQPVFVNGQFEPRLILPLSLSYDHRANDGADAARFLRWVAEALEQPLTLYIDK